MEYGEVWGGARIAAAPGAVGAFGPGPAGTLAFLERDAFRGGAQVRRSPYFTR